MIASMPHADTVPPPQPSAQSGPSIVTSGSRSGVISEAWLKSPSACFKIAEVVVGTVCFICVAVAPYFVKHDGGGWIQFVSITGILSSSCICILYLFDNISKLPVSVPWSFMELFHSALYSVLYLTAGILAAVKSSEQQNIYQLYFDEKDAMIAATVFSFIGVVIYGAEAVTLFFTFRQSHPDFSGSNPPRSAGPPMEMPPSVNSAEHGRVSY